MTSKGLKDLDLTVVLECGMSKGAVWGLQEFPAAK